jgi:hypothetical protein
MTYVALVGLTLLFVRGTIFRPLQRRWPAFLQCSQCVGTWVGFAAGASGVAVIAPNRAINTLLVGAATSVLSLGADAVLLKLLGDPGEAQ